LSKYPHILLLMLTSFSVIFGQADIYEKIQNEGNDSLKCLLLLEASDYYKYHSVDTLLLVADNLLATAEKLKSNHFLESAYNIKSLALKFKGEFSPAIEFSQKALDLNSQRVDNISRAKILLNYADLMRQQKQFDVSQRYHREGIYLSQAEKDSSLICRFYINSGLMFMDMDKPDSALHYYNLGISITDRVASLRKIGITARLNMSQLFFIQEKYEDMVALAQRVYEDALMEEDADHISLGANNVAAGYLKLGDFEKALIYITYAEEAARKYNSPQNLLFALGNASDIYAQKGDFKSAYEKALSYIGLKDSLRTALYDQNLLEMTTKYELKEKENLLNQHQLTIQKQASRQRFILWLSAILILSVLIIFFYLKSRQELKRKTAEIEAEKANLSAQMEHAEVERLQQMDDMRSNFFANISHEFRTPLTLIINPVEQLLKENGKLESKKYLNIIHRNASRMLELVNQLLELSKLESGKAVLKVGLYDLKKFARTIGGLFESYAKQNEVEFKLVFPQDEVIGYFDKDILEKIFINLISNAFKFTPSGGEIELGINKSAKNEIVISVRDTGIGISKDNLENLFDRFMSFSHSELQANSGIGLSLVRELVFLHKGKIEVESKVGTGSIFSVYLSLDKSSYDENEILSNNLQENSFSRPIPDYHLNNGNDHIVTKRIPELDMEHKPVLLIAEDNPDVMVLISDICKDHFQILKAENGKVALQLALDKIPDIVITDVMMPEMNGMQLCDEIRHHELTSHIPIVMLTARGDQKDKLAGLKTGVDDYLIKPFDADELLIRLHNLLNQRKVLQAHYKKVLHAFIPHDESVTSMDSKFLKNLRMTVEKNLHKESYGVSELASDLTLSRSQLHRKVSGLLGYSPNEIIRNMRLEKARILIQGKRGTIAEVAYDCGFNSPSYFSKCYKDYFGHTAGEE
jgi:signal transduction histidine kinase/DNA-binding response OmpR family regulator